MNFPRALARNLASRRARPVAIRRASAVSYCSIPRTQTRSFRTTGIFPAQQDVQKPNSYVDAGQLQFGQPVHETHPHLLQAAECK